VKLRLAWLADPEDADTYSARETRVLLRALARRGELVPLWFAAGSVEAPHFWNGIRVFPVPPDCLEGRDFLRTLIAQQRPQVMVSNLPRSAFPAAFEFLAQTALTWLHRVSPADAESEAVAGLPGMKGPGRHLVLLGRNGSSDLSGNTIHLPYLCGLDRLAPNGDEPTAVLRRLGQIVAKAAVLNQSGVHEALPSQPGSGGGLTGAASSHKTGEGPLAADYSRTLPHVVMRQQLFCNGSLAHVMFELTNALIELGVPTVPQEEHAVFSKGYIHREDDLFRAGAPDKYARVLQAVGRQYDPENAVLVHFTMLKPGNNCTPSGVFLGLAPREILYTTGNHAMTPEGLRRLAARFQMILAPSQHVLRPYLEAGLGPSRGAVIPHGIDPAVFSPSAPPFSYPTGKRFKFLQTSFPWITEKGFDLTLRAFARAFSSTDDVALILKVPRIRDVRERAGTFGRLEALVKETLTKPGAPEILLLESDVPLNRRGGIYTGADCYVFPLRAEGFAMTILEAMACGLPVIATPWSGPLDFLSPRHAYLLRHSNPIPERAKDGTLLRHHVEPDLDHLIHLMRRAYENRDEARRMGERAARLARGQWTWKHAAAKLAAALGCQRGGSRPDDAGKGDESL